MTLTRLSSSELYKGYDQVMQVLAELQHQYPHIKYLVVGKSDAGENQRLSNLVNELGISSRVIFTGFVPDAELADYFSIADLYIMPSKKEGFGIVFVEAMYYGLPVIAGNLDGSVDALCHGRLGKLVTPGNTGEIKEAVQRVMKDPEAYSPDRKLLMEQFSFSTYLQRVAQLTGHN
jgi:glycosyltransferase involved in cell wall biosynthesis